eukprot:5572241-Pleurochrysis_carterae.AAC.1
MSAAHSHERSVGSARSKKQYLVHAQNTTRNAIKIHRMQSKQIEDDHGRIKCQIRGKNRPEIGDREGEAAKVGS